MAAGPLRCLRPDGRCGRARPWRLGCHRVGCGGGGSLPAALKPEQRPRPSCCSASLGAVGSRALARPVCGDCSPPSRRAGARCAWGRVCACLQLVSASREQTTQFAGPAVARTVTAFRVRRDRRLRWRPQHTPGSRRPMEVKPQVCRMSCKACCDLCPNLNLNLSDSSSLATVTPGRSRAESPPMAQSR